MRARMLSSDSDEVGKVVLQINGNALEAMDNLGYGSGAYPAVGSEFEVDFTCLHSDQETRAEIFSSNPGRVQGLEPISGWSYRAFGRITAIDPEVLVDCGGIVLPAPIQTSDPRCIDTYVAFKVVRLEAWRRTPPNTSFERTREG